MMLTLPTESTVQMIERGQTMSELYPRLLERVLQSGERVAPRGRPTVELSPFIFQLDNPTQALVLQRERRLNRAYATVEKLALVGGVDDPAVFCFYVDRLGEFVNPTTGTFDGCYGPRVAGQLRFVYDTLRGDPDSRRAVITIYGQRDQHESLDVPCTLSLQFLLRSGKLSLLANMRSSDVYLGLPYDVNQFCFLQQVVAYWLGAKLGHYVHIAGSGHLYESDLSAVVRVVGSANDWLQAPGEPEFDVPFEETGAALAAFFEVERALRTSTPNADDIQRLPNCLRPLASYLRSFCLRKQTQG